MRLIDAIGVYLKLNPVTDSDIIKKLEGKKKQISIFDILEE